MMRWCEARTLLKVGIYVALLSAYFLVPKLTAHKYICKSSTYTQSDTLARPPKAAKP